MFYPYLIKYQNVSIFHHNDWIFSMTFRSRFLFCIHLGPQTDEMISNVVREKWSGKDYSRKTPVTEMTRSDWLEILVWLQWLTNLLTDSMVSLGLPPLTIFWVNSVLGIIRVYVWLQPVCPISLDTHLYFNTSVSL